MKAIYEFRPHDPGDKLSNFLNVSEDSSDIAKSDCNYTYDTLNLSD